MSSSAKFMDYLVRVVSNTLKWTYHYASGLEPAIASWCGQCKFSWQHASSSCAVVLLRTSYKEQLRID